MNEFRHRKRQETETDDELNLAQSDLWGQCVQIIQVFLFRLHFTGMAVEGRQF